MKIEWFETNAHPTTTEIVAFENRFGIRLHPEHVWFLQNIVNGGYPKPCCQIPTEDCPGGASLWHGVYGIDHPKDIYNLEWAIEANKGYFPRFIPFGSDDIGGDILIEIENESGRVFYTPHDPEDIYMSAKSINEFLTKLKRDEDV